MALAKAVKTSSCQAMPRQSHASLESKVYGYHESKFFSSLSSLLFLSSLHRIAQLLEHLRRRAQRASCRSSADSPALSRVLAAGDGVRDGAVLEAVQEAPAAGALGRPHEVAAGAGFEDVHLCLDVAAHLLDHVAVPARDVARLALAPRDRAAVSRSRRAVGVDADVGRWGPFAYIGWHDGVGGREVGCPAAGFGDVLLLREGIVRVAVHLVQMRIHTEVLCAATDQFFGDGCPGKRALEGIVHDNHEVLVCHFGFDCGVCFLGPGLSDGELVVTPADGLVGEFESDHHISILHGPIFSGHGLEDGDRLLQVVALLPRNVSSVAGVVKSVLASRRTMAVNPDLHTIGPRPFNSLLEVLISALNIRCVGVVIGPISDRNTKSIDSG